MARWMLGWGSWACVVASLLGLAPAPALAQDAPRDVRHTTGLTLAAGTGYAGTPEAQIGYVVDLGLPQLRVGAFASGGVGWLGSSERAAHPFPGIAVGGYGSFGRGSHRLYFDLAVSFHDLLVGNDVNERYWVTVPVGIGYEALTPGGFLFRGVLAPAASIFIPQSSRDPFSWFTVRAQLLFGYKFL